MFVFSAKLSAFSGLPTADAVRVVQALVDALTLTNVGYLREHTRTPALYNSGVYYCKDERGKEKQWWDIPAVLAHGCADCKALAAWRAAELIVAGYPAEPLVTTRDGNLFHVVVRIGNQVEDPSALLGMHAA
jgi:predicted transglutaminase-like cysteine proteinase